MPEIPAGTRPSSLRAKIPDSCSTADPVAAIAVAATRSSSSATSTAAGESSTTSAGKPATGCLWLTTIARPSAPEDFFPRDVARSYEDVESRERSQVRWAEPGRPCIPRGGPPPSTRADALGSDPVEIAGGPWGRSSVAARTLARRASASDICCASRTTVRASQSGKPRRPNKIGAKPANSGSMARFIPTHRTTARAGLTLLPFVVSN